MAQVNFWEMFKCSFEENVNGHEDTFYPRFHQNFLATSPVVSAIFSNIDMQKQVATLEQSLLLLVDFAEAKQSGESLKKLALTHLRIGVTAEMYEWWVQALISTLEQVDPNFRPADALAWRVTLAPAMEFMKHYKPYVDTR